MTARRSSSAFWVACPICGAWMKRIPYECKACLDAARAAGWSPEGQTDLLAEPFDPEEFKRARAGGGSA